MGRRYVKSVGRSSNCPVAMSAARVVTPTDSTLSRVVGSLNLAMPHTSLSSTRDSAIPKAILPAGPVIRIFSSLSNVGLFLRIFGADCLQRCQQCIESVFENGVIVRRGLQRLDERLVGPVAGPE